MRPIDADALKEDLTRFYDGEVTARDLIDEQPTIGGWISVKDGLPSLYHMVLLTGHNGVGGSFGVVKGSYDGDKAGWYRDDIGQYAKSR